MSVEENSASEQDLIARTIADRAEEQAASGLWLTFRSLRHRNYRLYFFGQLVSLLGSWMQTTAVMWLAFELTKQSKWPALVAAAQILPTFLVGAWSGALADRWPKRRLLLHTQSAFLVLAFMLAGLVFSGQATEWHLLSIALLQGLVQAIDLPARLAFLMEMVGREDLVNAVGLNSLLFNVARALGPAIAGQVLAVWGPGPCFVANALSYIALLVALGLMVEVDFSRPAASAGDEPAGPRSLWDGFRHVVERPAIGLLILLAGVVALAGWPFLSLLPGFAQRVLDLREGGYSAMLSSTGFGALAAAWTVARFGSLERRRTSLSVGVTLLGLALALLSWAHSLPVAMLACALVGYGLILFSATSQAVVQLSAGEHNRGQVMGIWAMVLSGAVPLGNLAAGPAADLWGEPAVVRAQSLVCLAATAALVLWFWRSRPSPER